MLNAAGAVEIPLVFEGDGSMLCVPAQMIDGARAALLRTQERARRSFELDLKLTRFRGHISMMG